MTRAYLILCAALALHTCEKEPAAKIQSSPTAVTAAASPDSIRLGQPIVSTITCGTPNPCWEFTRVDIAQSGFEYTVKVIAEYDGRPCIQVLGSFTTTSSITPTEKGTYTLRFWRAENQFLEKRIVVR